ARRRRRRSTAGGLVGNNSCACAATPISVLPFLLHRSRRFHDRFGPMILSCLTNVHTTAGKGNYQNTTRGGVLLRPDDSLAAECVFFAQQGAEKRRIGLWVWTFFVAWGGGDATLAKRRRGASPCRAFRSADCTFLRPSYRIQ